MSRSVYSWILQIAFFFIVSLCSGMPGNAQRSGFRSPADLSHIDPKESEGLERFFAGRYDRLLLEGIGHFPHRESRSRSLKRSSV